MTEELKPAIRDARGLFLPGNGGRPKGLSRAEKIRVMLEPETEEFIARLRSNAHSDDGNTSIQALKIIMGYLAPVSRSPGEHIELEGFAEAKTIAEKASIVTNAIAAGSISVEAGAAVMRCLQTLVDGVAHTELRKQVDALMRGSAARTIENGDLL